MQTRAFNRLEKNNRDRFRRASDSGFVNFSVRRKVNLKLFQF